MDTRSTELGEKSLTRLPLRAGVGLMLALYALLRLALSAVATLAYTFLLPLMPADVIQRLSLGLESIMGGLAGPLLGAWQRWDTLWYLAYRHPGPRAIRCRCLCPVPVLNSPEAGEL